MCSRRAVSCECGKRIPFNLKEQCTVIIDNQMYFCCSEECKKIVMIYNSNPDSVDDYIGIVRR